MSVDITQSYPIATCSPGQPLLSIAGGTGVSNIGTLTFSGDVSLTPGISGSITLTVTAGSGVSAPSVVGPTLASALGSSIGNVVSVKTSISFTATASTAIFNIGIPVLLTGLFADASQANGVVNVTSGTGGGSLSSLVSVSSSRNIAVTLALGGSSGTYTVNLDFSFFVN